MFQPICIPTKLFPSEPTEPKQSGLSLDMLRARIVFCRLNVPLFTSPPARKLATLREMVLLVMVMVPKLKSPPPRDAVLSATVLLVIVAVPPLKRPPRPCAHWALQPSKAVWRPMP